MASKLSYPRGQGFVFAEETQALFDKAVQRRKWSETMFAATGGPKLQARFFRAGTSAADLTDQELLDSVAVKGHMDGWGTRISQLHAFERASAGQLLGNIGQDISSGLMVGEEGLANTFVHLHITTVNSALTQAVRCSLQRGERDGAP